MSTVRSGVEITVTPDGPLIVRGPVRLVNTSGEQVGSDRRTIALCRCGYSRMKPFCDGTHKIAGFTDS